MKNGELVDKLNKTDNIVYFNSNCVNFTDNFSVSKKNMVFEEVYSDLDFKEIIKARKMNMFFLEKIKEKGPSRVRKRK